MKKKYVALSVCGVEEWKKDSVAAIPAAVAAAAAAALASEAVSQLFKKNFGYNQSVDCLDKVEIVYE